MTAEAATLRAGTRRADAARHPPRRLARWVLLLAPAAFLAAFFLWPLVTVLRRGLSWSALGDVVTDDATRQIVWFTIWQAVVSTVLTVALGLAPTYVLARYRFPGRRTLLALVTVPFVLPTIAVGAAFLAVLPESMHGTVRAMLIAHVWVNLAVVVRTVGTLVAQLDPALEDAAATLGASPWRRFRHVVLPLAWPSIVAAASIVFLFCFTSFGIARVLAGPAHPTLEVEIWRRATQAFDLRIACALAVLQLLVVGAAMAWSARVQRRAARPMQLRSTARLRVARTARQRLLVGAVGIATAVVVVVPIAMVVMRSFRVRSQWSLAAWRAVLRGPGHGVGAAAPVLTDPLATVGASLRIALAATIIAVVVGGLAATAIEANRRAGRWLDTGLMLPLGTSAVVVGFGLLITFDRAPFDLRGSAIMLPLGQALVAIPFVVRAMLPTLRAVDPDLRHAAATLGASPARTWREVDLPMLRRAIGVAAGFAFAISLGEFGATSFLTRAGNETIPIGIARLLGRPSTLNLAQAFVLTTLLIAMTTAVVLAFDLLREGRETADRR